MAITNQSRLLHEIAENWKKKFNSPQELRDILLYMAENAPSATLPDDEVVRVVLNGDYEVLETQQSTSNTIFYSDARGTIYGTSILPLTGDLIHNLDSAKSGTVNIVYHQNSAEPNDTGITIVDQTGQYAPNELNIIFYQYLTNGEVIKVMKNAASGNVGAFTDLSDAPSSYTGQAGKKVVVNETEDGLEFVADTAPPTTFDALTDTPSTKTAKAVPAVNDAANAIIYSNVFYDVTTGEVRIGNSAATGARAAIRGYGTTISTLAMALQNGSGTTWLSAYDSQQLYVKGNGVSDGNAPIFRVMDSDNTPIFSVVRAAGGARKIVTTLVETDTIVGNASSYKLNIAGESLGTTTANDYGVGIRSVGNLAASGSRWFEVNTRFGTGAVAANKSNELIRLAPDARSVTVAFTQTLKGLSDKFWQSNPVNDLTNGVVDYTSLSLTPQFKTTGGTKYKYTGIDIAFDSVEFNAASFTNLLTDCIGIKINPLTSALTETNWNAIDSVKGLWKAVMPTYADNAAAVSGGLAVNTFYKTATGELRIVV